MREERRFELDRIFTILMWFALSGKRRTRRLPALHREPRGRLPAAMGALIGFKGGIDVVHAERHEGLAVALCKRVEDGAMLEAGLIEHLRVADRVAADRRGARPEVVDRLGEI